MKLNSSRITLNPGKSYTLKVNGTKLTPAWRSSNSKIVTVNKKGRITAKKAGTAKITARLGGKKFVCTVTVKKHQPRQTSWQRIMQKSETILIRMADTVRMEANILRLL